MGIKSFLINCRVTNYGDANSDMHTLFTFQVTQDLNLDLCLLDLELDCEDLTTSVP